MRRLEKEDRVLGRRSSVPSDSPEGLKEVPKGCSVTVGVTSVREAGTRQTGRGGHTEDVDLTQSLGKTPGRFREPLLHHTHSVQQYPSSPVVKQCAHTQLATADRAQGLSCPPHSRVSGPVAIWRV